MLTVVHGVERPEGLQGAPCCQQDLIPTRVHGHELCDVIDASFVGDPDAVLQRAVTGDLLLGVDWERWGLLNGLHRGGLGLLCLEPGHRHTEQSSEQEEKRSSL